MDVPLLPSVSVTIKARKEVVDLAEEMAKLGLARSRNHAFNIILETGLENAQKMVERKREAKKLLRLFLERGLPYRNPPTVRDVEEGREL